MAVLDQTITALEILRPLCKAMPLVGTQLEAATETVLAICLLVQGTRVFKEDAAALAEHAALLVAGVTDAIKQANMSDDDRLREDLRSMQNVLEEIKAYTSKQAKKKFVVRMFGQKKDEDELARLKTLLANISARFNIVINTRTGIAVQQVVQIVERIQQNQNAIIRDANNAILEKLHPVHSARFDFSGAPPGCLENTRVEILRQVSHWFQTPGLADILWLCGLAGTGKSTIARTVCEQAVAQGYAVASFFVSWKSSDRRDIARIISSLAYQLGRQDALIMNQLCVLLRQDPDIVTRPLPEQVRCLLAQPLSDLKDKKTILLVVDALDECDRSHRLGATNLITLLALAFPENNRPFRILITSRVDEDIQQKLDALDKQGVSHTKFELHSIEKDVVRSDIKHFLRHSLAKVALRYPDLLVQGWPSEEAVSSLALSSGSLFIFASTAIRYIDSEDYDPEDRLNTLLSSSPSQFDSPYKNLDELYTQALDHAVSGETDPVHPLCQRCRLFLGLLVSLQDPLPEASLIALLDTKPREARITLKKLSALLIPSNSDGTVQIFHHSLRDFLLDSSRCSDPRFKIKLEEAHELLARRCLALMNHSLRFNLLGISSSTLLNEEISKLSDLMEDQIPHELRYACKYWTAHLSKCGGAQLSLQAELMDFCHKHLLHWLEVLSLLQELAVASKILADAQEWLQHQSPPHNDALRLLYDSERMINQFYAPIKQSALQVYYSAAVFLPECSLQKRVALIPEQSSTVLVSDRYPFWSPMIHVMEGHTSWVEYVAISADTTRVASGSNDHTVRVWDAQSGDLVHILRGHFGPINAVVFLSNTLNVLSGSDDATVRLWDCLTGQNIAVMRGPSTMGVTSLVVEEETNCVACGSYDCSIWIIDYHSGKVVSQLKGHEGSVITVSISNASCLLASGSADKTVRLWNTSDWEVVLVLQGHEKEVTAITFSPDGSRVYSASVDFSIRFWDVTTGDCITTIAAHSFQIISLCISHDGTMLASASLDDTTRLWNAHTGEHELTLRGHLDGINSVAMFPDGTKLVTGSNDYSVRVWDIHPDRRRSAPILEGHTEEVNVVIFSWDGMYIASGSEDRTVRLWDAFCGKYIHKFEGHSAGVNALAFSHDNKYLLSGSADANICAWKVDVGELVTTIEASKINDSSVTALVCARNGQYFASGHEEGLVRVWLLYSWDEKHILTGHTGTVCTADFHPDSTRLCTGTQRGELRVWNMETREALFHVDAGSSGIRNVSSLKYVADGTHIALRTLDGGVCEYKLESEPNGNTLVQELQLSATYLTYDVSSGWLYCNPAGTTITPKRLCWIPSDRRAHPDRIISNSDDSIHVGEIIDSYGHRVVIGGGNGVVTILDISHTMSGIQKS